MASQGWSVDSLLESKSPTSGGALESLLDWAIGLCVFTCLWLYLPSWGHSPLLAKWLPVALLPVLYLGRLWQTARHRGMLAFDPLDGIALLLLAWAALSLAWSPDSLGGRDTLIKWGLFTVLFIAARHGTSPTTRSKIAVGAALGMVVVMGLDVLGVAYHGGYMNPNFETEAILFAMPFLLVLTGSRTSPMTLAIAALMGLPVVFLIFFNSSKIEFLVWTGIGILIVSGILWRRSKGAAITTLTLLVSGVGALVYLGWESGLSSVVSSFKGSIYPRLELLANGLSIWWNAPLLGHGAGFMYPTYPLFQEHYIHILGSGYKSALLTGFQLSAGALHNDLLQFMAAFGLIGLGLLIAGLVFAKKQLAEWRQSPDRMAGAIVMVTCLMNTLVEFPLQQPATAMLAVLGLAFLLPGAAPDESSASSSPSSNWLTRHAARVIPIVFMASIPAIGWWSYRYYIANDAFGAARQLAFAGRPDLAVQLNLGAVGAYPFDEAMRYELYNTLMFLEERSGTISVPPEVHDQIFETSLSTGLGNGLMIFRLEYLLNSGRYKERAEEVARWRKQLTTNVTRLPDTWLMEGLYAVADGDPDRAKAALARYMELTGGTVPPERQGIVESIRQGIR